MKRKDSPLPYVSHPFDVLKRLSRWDVTDENVLAAALLHDVIEDAGVTFDQLVSVANTAVARIVRAVSWPLKMSAAAKFDHLHALPGIVDTDILPDVLLLKMADRLCNVADYDHAETRQNISPNRSYASKYALLGFPVFAAWATRRVELTALRTVQPTPARPQRDADAHDLSDTLMADLTDYVRIVRRRYPAFDTVYATSGETARAFQTVCSTPVETVREWLFSR